MKDFRIHRKHILKIDSTKFDNFYNSLELSKHIPNVMDRTDVCLQRFVSNTKIIDSIYQSQGIK